MKLTTGSIRFFETKSPALTGVTIELGNSERIASVTRVFIPEGRKHDSLVVAEMLRDLADVLERA